MMRLIEYSDREALFTALAEGVALELAKALADEKARATLAVPGGTTPGPFLERLREARLDWPRVRVMLTDERWVDESSPRSNTRLLRETLLAGPAAAAELVPLYRPARTPEEVLDELAAGVAAALPITSLVLGMGEDMHTASLFPGADRLAEALSADAPPLLAMRAPGAGEPRVTLTAPVLRGARHIHLLIAGEAKRAALERACAPGPVEEAPVRIVLDRATVHWAA